MEMLIIVLILVVLTIIFIRKCCRKRGQDTRSERQPLLEEDYEFYTDTYLPGSLLTAQTQSFTEGSPEDSKKLVEILVDKFKTQRQCNSEFAVLFLLSSRRLGDWIQSIEGGQYETDNHRNSVPNRDDALTNYITARPGGNRHAEVNILNRLDQLMSQYQSKKFPQLQSILLYTWIPPCEACTQVIRTILGPHASTHRVVVIYTVKDNDTTPAGAYDELKNMKIEVEKVKYRSFLRRPYQPAKTWL